MKTYTVCVPVDYIRGYLRYGHVEFDIEAESVEEAIQKSLNIIKEHTSIPSDIEIKIIPNEFASDGKWDEDMVFIIPTSDKPLKVVFENK